jgi:hypothetical protein
MLSPCRKTLKAQGPDFALVLRENELAQIASSETGLLSGKWKNPLISKSSFCYGGGLRLDRAAI